MSPSMTPAQAISVLERMRREVEDDYRAVQTAPADSKARGVKRCEERFGAIDRAIDALCRCDRKVSPDLVEACLHAADTFVNFGRALRTMKLNTEAEIARNAGESLRAVVEAVAHG